MAQPPKMPFALPLVLNPPVTLMLPDMLTTATLLWVMVSSIITAHHADVVDFMIPARKHQWAERTVSGFGRSRVDAAIGNLAAAGVRRLGKGQRDFHST